MRIYIGGKKGSGKTALATALAKAFVPSLYIEGENVKRRTMGFSDKPRWRLIVDDGASKKFRELIQLAPLHTVIVESRHAGQDVAHRAELHVVTLGDGRAKVVKDRYNAVFHFDKNLDVDEMFSPMTIDRMASAISLALSFSDLASPEGWR